MNIYIALIRGINVSGQKKILMTDLKELLKGIGLKDVVTYIQSGNIIFSSEKMTIDILENEIKEKIKDHYGFDVPVLVLSKESVVQIVEETPFDKLLEGEKERVYYTLLKNAPSKELVAILDAHDYEGEKFYITEKCVYFTSLHGYGRAKCNNNFFEKKLKVSATTRNLKTMMKLIKLASN
ncbi:MAG: hypothetical protein COA50_01085 [Flavobacteriaceae bacterium]|nr:MAG: hypothetical protein COA50_01085 [Flavobacteriaceae bacterium]